MQENEHLNEFIGDIGSILEFPKNWTTDTSSVKLVATDTEYQKISREFKKTCQRPIVKVCDL